MIKNSTNKYREMYPKGGHKISQSTTVLSLNSSATLSNLDCSRKSMPVIDKSISTKKLETFSIRPTQTPFTSSHQSQRSSLKKASILKQVSQKMEKRQSAESSNPSRVVNNLKAEKFIESVPKNTLFYCCSCFQYVFEIEKKRHYPDCKDVININDHRNQRFRATANNRLENIVQLSRYTGHKTEQVEKLYEFYKDGALDKLQEMQCPKEPTFLTLQQIQLAFLYTFRELLKGQIFYNKSGLLNCF